MKGILAMSHKDLERLEVIGDIEKKRLTVKEGSEKCGLSERQMYRLLKRVRIGGKEGIIHGLRGKSSNRGYDKELKEQVIEIYKSGYGDYGPTLYSEELLKVHSIGIDHETIRRWLRSSGIAVSIRKLRPHRKRRERRGSFGELLQFDGSPHAWFEERGPECCLFVCVDDATNYTYAKFARSENSADAMRTMWEYIELNGIPRSLYTDRFGIYRGEQKLPDFARAMQELKTEMIYAKSPQAKGRVENKNKVLQDRLVKAMRQSQICTIAEGNRFLREEFLATFNEKFTLKHETENVHRSKGEINLEEIFCYKTERAVRNDYTINLSGGYIQLLVGEAPLPKPRQYVVLHKHLTGQIKIYFNGQSIAYEVINGNKPKQGYKYRKPAKEHPWRKMNNLIESKKNKNFA